VTKLAGVAPSPWVAYSSSGTSDIFIYAQTIGAAAGKDRRQRRLETPRASCAFAGKDRRRRAQR